MAVSAVTFDDVAQTLGRALSTSEQAQATLWIDDAEMLIGSRLGDLADLDATQLAYVVRESVADRLRTGVAGGAESISVAIDDGTVTRRYPGERGTADGDWLIDGWVALLSKRQQGGPFSVMPWFAQDTAS